MATCGGIFVGGAGARMGGVAKGLIEAPDGVAIAVRLQRIFAELAVPCVLVGRRAEYAGLGLDAIDDAPSGIGPLGGVCALLRHANGGRAIAVACDMPFVTKDLVARLVAAPDAPAIAPRIDGRWQPMLARYDARLALPIAERRANEGKRSLQGLLDELGAVHFSAEPNLLADWDAPGDIDA